MESPRHRPELITVNRFAELASSPPWARCSRDHARQLLAAGGLGPGYQLGHHVVYDLSEALELFERPKITVSELGAHLPSAAAVVLRQLPRQQVAPGADRTRDWWGVDLLAPDKEQRLASNRWWPLSPATRRRFATAITENEGHIPLLVTVGGLIVRGYDITGLDQDASRAHDTRYAFALAPGKAAWSDAVERVWLDSRRHAP